MWHALANRSGRDDADRSAGSSPWTEGIRHGGVGARDAICIPARTSEGVQELSVVCHFSLGSGLLRAEVGEAEGAERAG